MYRVSRRSSNEQWLSHRPSIPLLCIHNSHERSQCRMPRPKVDPAHRQRSIIACGPCKSAKIRCDSKTPCSTCVKRSREDQCVYEQPAGDGVQRRKRRSTTGAVPGSTSPSNPRSSFLRDDTRPTPDSSGDGDFSTNDEGQGPKGRMLLSSKFQKGNEEVKPMRAYKC